MSARLGTHQGFPGGTGKRCWGEGCPELACYCHDAALVKHWMCGWMLSILKFKHSDLVFSQL